MTTVAVTMTGSPVAVAGEGAATVTNPKGPLRWFLGAPGGGASAPAATHVIKKDTDQSFDVPASTELYVMADSGDVVAVTRDQAPA